jgi:tetratricopeptide (TPR) repeat protein
VGGWQRGSGYSGSNRLCSWWTQPSRPSRPPHDVRSWPVWEPFQPHAAFVVDQADQAGLAEPTAQLMNELGVFLTTKCMFSEAEPLCRRALAIDEVAYGLTHPTVARDLNNLAALLQETNRLAEAEPLFRRALAIDEAAYGPIHPMVARDLINLAALLQETNRLAEAEPLMRQPVSILKHFNDSTGHEHPHWQAALASYSGLLQAIGLSQEEIARRLQEAAGRPASHSESSDTARGLLAWLRRGITHQWRQRKEQEPGARRNA